MGPTVSSLQGSTFVVSDRSGDVDASPRDPQGLFYHDTRFLSRWRLRIDGEGLSALSTDDVHYAYAQFFLVRGTGTVYTDSSVSVLRQRFVGDGFHEDLTVMNHGREPIELEVRLDVGADFADLFEVKDALERRANYQHVEGGRIVLGYTRERFVRETWISATARRRSSTRTESPSASASRRMESGAPASTSSRRFRAIRSRSSAAVPARRVGGEAGGRREPGGVAGRRAGARVRLGELEQTYGRSLVDLAALRFYPAVLREGQLCRPRAFRGS